MVFARAQPDGHLTVRVQIRIDQAEQAGVVIKRAGHSLDESRKVQSDDVQLDSNLRKVLLNHRGHFLSRGVTRVGDHRELHAIASAVSKYFFFVLESDLYQQAQRTL